MKDMPETLLKRIWARSEGRCECCTYGHGHSATRCDIFIGVEKVVETVFNEFSVPVIMPNWDSIKEGFNKRWFVQIDEPWNELTFDGCQVVCFYCFGLINYRSSIDVKLYKETLMDIRYKGGYWIITGNTLGKTNRQ
jgi:hypothetical protein